jgi:hypothetical protein
MEASHWSHWSAKRSRYPPKTSCLANVKLHPPSQDAVWIYVHPIPWSPKAYAICLGSRCGVKAALPPAWPCTVCLPTPYAGGRREKPPGKKTRACLTHVSLPPTHPYMFDMRLHPRIMADPESRAPALTRETLDAVWCTNWPLWGQLHCIRHIAHARQPWQHSQNRPLDNSSFR